jgi:hypothetical protein
VIPKQAKLLIPVAHLVLDLYTESLGISPAVSHLVRNNVIVQILIFSLTYAGAVTRNVLNMMQIHLDCGASSFIPQF